MVNIESQGSGVNKLCKRSMCADDGDNVRCVVSCYAKTQDTQHLQISD